MPIVQLKRVYEEIDLVINSDSDPLPPKRILFAGSGDLAVTCFMALRQFCLKGNQAVLCGVLTKAPEPAGRGLQLRPTELGRYLEAHPAKEVFPVITVTNLNDQADAILEQTMPDLLLVADFGMWLPKQMLHIPSLGAINIHPSLLPKWRGAVPVPAAIQNGDSVTGVTIQQMVTKMDAGPLLAQQTCAIKPVDTAQSLSQTLANAAAMLLPDTLERYLADKITPQEQDESAATYCYEEDLDKDKARIDWTQSNESISRAIRAFNPKPLAWTTFRDKRVLVHFALPCQNFSQPAREPGALALDKKKLLVWTGSGCLEITQIQPEGKNPMDAVAFINGYRPQTTDMFI